MLAVTPTSRTSRSANYETMFSVPSCGVADARNSGVESAMWLREMQTSELPFAKAVVATCPAFGSGLEASAEYQRAREADGEGRVVKCWPRRISNIRRTSRVLTSLREARFSRGIGTREDRFIDMMLSRYLPWMTSFSFVFYFGLGQSPGPHRYILARKIPHDSSWTQDNMDNRQWRAGCQPAVSHSERWRFQCVESIDLPG